MAISSSHRKTWWITSVYRKQKIAVWEWEWFFVCYCCFYLFSIYVTAPLETVRKKITFNNICVFFLLFFHIFRSLNKVNLIRLFVMSVKLWNCFCRFAVQTHITYLSISFSYLYPFPLKLNFIEIWSSFHMKNMYEHD